MQIYSSLDLSLHVEICISVKWDRVLTLSTSPNLPKWLHLFTWTAFELQNKIKRTDTYVDINSRQIPLETRVTLLASRDWLTVLLTLLGWDCLYTRLKALISTSKALWALTSTHSPLVWGVKLECRAKTWVPTRVVRIGLDAHVGLIFP
jgi:hypothetical protein